VLGPLLDLLLPRECAACLIPGSHLCVTCSGDLWAVAPEWVQPQIVARPDSRGIGRAVVRAHKERGQHALVEMLGALVSDATTHLLNGAGHWPPTTPVVLVPVPTRRRAYGRRGFNPAASVAAAAVNDLTPHTRAVVRHLVTLVRQPGDQRGLGASDRVVNIAGTMRCRRSAPASLIVVVDDVITTGATLNEVMRALVANDATPLGAVAAVATPLARPSAQ